MHRATSDAAGSTVCLVIIAVAYVALGVLYAVNVPRWNAPDEPAHFNYIRFVAERAQFPELRPGSYDVAYLEQLKAARFPPELSIDTLQYEAHQPPLYYVIAAALFKLSAPLGFASQVLALRLLSVLIGLILLFVGYATARRVMPQGRGFALGVMALLAFLPMHTAVNAAIGNDPLSNLALAVIVWESVGLVPASRRPRANDKGTSLVKTFVPSWPHLRLGLWLGLALLTKTTAYSGVLVAAVAVILAAQRLGQARAAAQQVAGIWAVALLVSGWWFIRNATVYGLTDPLGLRRHDAIMIAAGQPQTGGLSIGMLAEMARIAFQSLWGQFGWMGVLMDERVYTVLAGVSLVAGAGFVIYLTRLWPDKTVGEHHRHALAVLLLTAMLVAGAMAQYNVSSFLQPQGRYLFPALVPLAIAFTLGIRTVVSRQHFVIVIGSLALTLACLDFFALYRYILPVLT